MLNDLLKVAGLARDRVFVTNVVKYRPPGNRTPSGREVEDGRTALRAEWAIIAPRLTIAVGRPAQTALGLKESPHGIIGAWDRAGTALVVSVYHPAFGMRWKKARTWIENEWEQLAEGIKVYCPEVL